MTESQLRALFNQIADDEPGPSRVDTKLLLRRGRARVRWRRACVAGAPVLAAVAVVALAVTAGPVRPGPGPAAGAGRVAPCQFNPVVPYVSFGWLPEGESLYSGDVRPTEMFLAAGRPANGPEWGLNVYARGQCHLAGPDRGLKCPHQGLDGTTARFKFTARAPAVDAHRAFWTGTSLVWQYAHGGWAALTWPASVPNGTPRQDTVAQRQAIKIAEHLRFGAATPPLVFPAQLTGLTSQWRISDVYYLPDAGVLRAESFMLTTGTSRYLPHVGDLGVWTNAPYVEIHPSPRNGTCTPHDPATNNTSEIINGYRVVVKRMTIGGVPQQELCAAHADGFWLSIIEFGPHPSIDVASLFRQHMRLLSTNPANWTKNPIG
jgi:hypothetical protein